MQQFKFKRQVLGQTLIETLVTVIVIGIGVVALIRFQNYLSYDNTLARQRVDATTVASNKMEELVDYQLYTTTTGYNAYLDIATGSSTATVGNTTYSLAWTVTANSNPTYKTIDLTSSWTDIRNVAQSVRLVTRVAGVDPSDQTAIK